MQLQAEAAAGADGKVVCWLLLIVHRYTFASSSCWVSSECLLTEHLCTFASSAYYQAHTCCLVSAIYHLITEGGVN